MTIADGLAAALILLILGAIFPPIADALRAVLYAVKALCHVMIASLWILVGLALLMYQGLYALCHLMLAIAPPIDDKSAVVLPDARKQPPVALRSLMRAFKRSKQDKAQGVARPAWSDDLIPSPRQSHPSDSSLPWKLPS